MEVFARAGAHVAFCGLEPDLAACGVNEPHAAVGGGHDERGEGVDRIAPLEFVDRDNELRRGIAAIYREQIRSLHESPAQLLNAPALVPLDQYAGDGHSPNDLYVFAFLTGLVTADLADVQKAVDAGQPLYLMHTMPPSWVRPQVWTPLGRLVLKSEWDQPLTVELGGQDAARDFITRSVELRPRTRLQVDGDFYSLAYLHVNAMPGARLGIHSPRRQETYLIEAASWGNTWIYGMRIYLTGWVTREQYRQRASLLPVGSRVFQYDRTRTRNLALAISQLRPIGDLLSQARAWGRVKSNDFGTSVV